jgi:hypothetical protein
LTGAVRPSVDGHALMAQRERYGRSSSEELGGQICAVLSMESACRRRHGSSSKISTKTSAVTGIVAR